MRDQVRARRQPWLTKEEHDLHHVVTNCEPESRAKQEFKSDCDINALMAKYKKTGAFNHLPSRMMAYGDFTGVDDLKTAIDQVEDAKAAFMELPADIRKAVDHDPSKFEAWLADEDNHEEARRYGLIEGEPTKTAEAPNSPGPEPSPEPEPTPTE